MIALVLVGVLVANVIWHRTRKRTPQDSTTVRYPVIERPVITARPWQPYRVGDVTHSVSNGHWRYLGNGGWEAVR